MKANLCLAVLAVAMPVAACTSELDSTVLAGTWGGDAGQVTASLNGVVATLTCGAVLRIAHGVVLDSTGTFITTDSLLGWPAGARDTVPQVVPVSVNVIGTATGDKLDILLPLVQNSGSSSVVTAGGAVVLFDGRRGQPAGESACRT
jgi:hypothetical protein